MLREVTVNFWSLRSNLWIMHCVVEEKLGSIMQVDVTSILASFLTSHGAMNMFFRLVKSQFFKTVLWHDIWKETIQQIISGSTLVSSFPYTSQHS